MAAAKRNQSEVLERVISLEANLAAAIQKLDAVVTAVAKNQELFHALFAGDSEVPGLLSRVISLEKSDATCRWALSVLYVAGIGALVKALIGG